MTRTSGTARPRSAPRRTPSRTLVGLALIVGSVGIAAPSAPVAATELPAQFVSEQVVNGLDEPDALDFSSDGRMFISERITGALRVAVQNPTSGAWSMLPTPFHTFNIPTNAAGQPEGRRSAGLRDIAFDPNFSTNGYIYAFYMDGESLHNRVVRIKASTANPNISSASFGEETLIDLPFNSTSSSGSHNGGAMEFGADGYLYITTGDGWTGEFAGDPVQSLTTFTGKVLRISPTGFIPSDNPFYTRTSGSYRAIYALGLRNPYSMSKHPVTRELFINEARGVDKAEIYLLQAGANYRHQGVGTGLGNDRSPWANAGTGTAELITGGVWYPEGGSFPSEYHGSYFAAMWGGNDRATGTITRIASRTDHSVTVFEDAVGRAGSNGLANKPVRTQVGPDGALYYLLTTYQTNSGSVQRVSYTANDTVAAPTLSPANGNYDGPVDVKLTTATPNAVIHYTLDASGPTEASTRYVGPIRVAANTVITARAFRPGFSDSSATSASYTIDTGANNQPPLVSAGPDRTVVRGIQAVLDGSGTTDPDGNEELLFGERWTQISGPPVTIFDSSEETAYFLPWSNGVYRFRLEMSDSFDTASDEVTIIAVDPAPTNTTTTVPARTTTTTTTTTAPARTTTTTAAARNTTTTSTSTTVPATSTSTTSTSTTSTSTTSTSTTTTSTVPVPTPPPVSSRPCTSNAITNGGFEDGISGWTFHTTGSGSDVAVARANSGIGAARINIARRGKVNQYFQPGVSLQAATEYTLTFAGRTTNPNRALRVDVLEHDDDYTNYGLDRAEVMLSTEWTDHTLTFTTPSADALGTNTVTDARLRFWLNNTTGDTVHLDDICLRPSITVDTPGTAPSPTPSTVPGVCVGDLVTNGDFATGVEDWTFHTTGTGTATYDRQFGSDRARVEITRRGAVNQFFQSGVELDADTVYTLTFSARTTNPYRALWVDVLEHDDDYTNYGLDRAEVMLSTEWNDHTLTFTTPSADALGTNTVTDARLRFWLNNSSGDSIHFADVCLTRS